MANLAPYCALRLAGRDPESIQLSAWGELEGPAGAERWWSALPEERWAELLAPRSYESLVESGDAGLLHLPTPVPLADPSRFSAPGRGEAWDRSKPWFEALPLGAPGFVLYPNDDGPSAELGLMTLTPVDAEHAVVTPLWLALDLRGRLRRARTGRPVSCLLHIAADRSLSCRSKSCGGECVALFSHDAEGDRAFLRCVCE